MQPMFSVICLVSYVVLSALDKNVLVECTLVIAWPSSLILIIVYPFLKIKMRRCWLLRCHSLLIYC